MAKVVEQFPKKTRKSKYPFDQWFDGQIWELTEGVDFKIPAPSFRGGLYNKTRLFGVEIVTASTTNEAGKVVYTIQAVPVGTKAKAKAAKPTATATPAKKTAAKKTASSKK